MVPHNKYIYKFRFCVDTPLCACSHTEACRILWLHFRQCNVCWATFYISLVATQPKHSHLYQKVLGSLLYELMNAFYCHYTKYNEIESISFPVNTHVEYENTHLITHVHRTRLSTEHQRNFISHRDSPLQPLGLSNNNSWVPSETHHCAHERDI